MIVPSNFRLGYACICTELRKNDIFASRTVRLATLKSKGIEYVKELALKNLSDLLTILKWNKDNGIYFMRLSSEMFPFAGHLVHGYSLDFADNLLKEIGQYARDNNMRLTMHPGQYDVLSSPSEIVIANTVSDLKHHCDILDRMCMGPDSVMIIHGGGVYGNKPEALKRLEENIVKLPENVRNRLVLENCEMAYCVEDLLDISENVGIPIVLDFHHDDIHGSSQPIHNYFNRVFAVWHKRGIKPKVHVSNSVPGVSGDASKTARRKHSDYIRFLHDSLLTITFPIDVMLECKMKEQALLRLKPINLKEFFDHRPTSPSSKKSISKRAPKKIKKI
jgi:UV DNA damage endonuclease